MIDVAERTARRDETATEVTAVAEAAATFGLWDSHRTKYSVAGLS